MGTRTRSTRRPKRRTAASATLALALALTASGCVTVHGELEVVPAATRAEAAQALKDFTDAYNKADKAYDPALVAGRVTGALAAINQAALRARRQQSPAGNPGHRELALGDARFLIPKKAGWPRWFVADTDSNRDTDRTQDGGGTGADSRWLIVFVRGGADQLWEASHLLTLPVGKVPDFAVDPDGFAKAVPPDGRGPATPPGELSRAYASYLQRGGGQGGAAFTPGPYTTAWLAQRKQASQRVGRSMQYLDQPLDTGVFAPVALATADGGAFVFFATRHFEKQTAAPGVPLLDLNADVRALMTGTPRSSLLKERVASQVALVPERGAAGTGVDLQSRVQGLVSAQGS
ncbi:hypothetical protein [Streptomyces candidus]|uniref:DUF8094 domain-containing protein n=1 Tax=Streptomyces candidus TaxID=67283 RepID=A0A7X0HA54_9ACTN|nr:hypothetical protein [Streptomyces candidus]MBB6433896.1 hypothetical protein [Streptomyces candidus]GHH34130.1 putative lipoprotein [Streptomyces candidus]